MTRGLQLDGFEHVKDIGQVRRQTDRQAGSAQAAGSTQTDRRDGLTDRRTRPTGGRAGGRAASDSGARRHAAVLCDERSACAPL